MRIILFLLHVLVGILIVSSPFWVDWRVILIGVLLYFIQHFTYGSCIISVMEFKSKKISFVDYYLKQIGFNFPKEQVDLIITWVVPFLLLGLAVILQTNR